MQVDRTADEAGLATLAVPVALAGLVVAILVPVLAVLPTRTVDAFVCTVRTVLPSAGEARCGSEGRRLWHLAQDRRDPADTDAGLDPLLRRHADALRRYWGAVRPPLPDAHVLRGSGVGSSSQLHLPSSSAPDDPLIVAWILRDPDHDRTVREIWEAIGIRDLAHVHSLLYQLSHGPPRGLYLIELADDWSCHHDCAAYFALRLRADCHAGAFAAWAEREGLLGDPQTAERMVAFMRAQLSRQGTDSGGFVEASERRAEFQRGYEAQRDLPRPDPIGACEPSVS
jgi:hypothetical protein